ncbi:MAG TPA: signal recognition particle-docking protein FtsY, partial [Candidatus Bathyarchaeota archaeon]|nr:signal recognition particle-docking protein FtsY [Candidatus Bathyarchaeota archaeon]
MILELVRNDVAYELAEEIAERIKEVLRGRKIKRIGDNVEELIKNEIQKFLKEEIPENSFELEEGIREAVNEGKPYKVMFIGVNGSGKTTTIAKIAYK